MKRRLAILREPLKDRALGRWTGILPAIGVSTKSLTGRHTACPICNAGKDRFRFDDKGGRGTWICSQCGAGDGIELVKRILGLEFREAAAEIEKHLGEAPVVRRNEQPSDNRKREAMRALWKRSRPITSDDHAGRYLVARTGVVDFPSSLRYSADERYAGPPSSFHPAMVAKVDPSDIAIVAGAKSALHRTYLGEYATKANVSSPRMMLGSMPSGAAVRLMEHGDTLGIAEGIETAFSASALFNVPCWAALTAGLLQDWSPPVSVRNIFVFADNDHSMTGQAAAYVLAARLKAKGLHVIVELPDLMGNDWNDVHQRQMGAA